MKVFMLFAMALRNGARRSRASRSSDELTMSQVVRLHLSRMGDRICGWSIAVLFAYGLISDWSPLVLLLLVFASSALFIPAVRHKLKLRRYRRTDTRLWNGAHGQVSIAESVGLIRSGRVPILTQYRYLADGLGRFLLFRLPPGVILRDFEDRMPAIADAFGALSGNAEQPKPGWVLVELLDRDPLSVVREPAWGHPAPDSADLDSPADVADASGGDPWWQSNPGASEGPAKAEGES